MADAYLAEGIFVTVTSGLAADAAKSGYKAVLERARSSASGMGLGRKIIDLTDGAKVTTRVSVRFSTISAINTPYWLHFGIQRAGGQLHMFPVLGEQDLELRVARDEYELFALFLTEPASFEKPLLVAFGSSHVVLLQQRRLVRVEGRQLSRSLIKQAKAKFPGGQLPYRLPSANTRLREVKAILASAKGIVGPAKAEETRGLGLKDPRTRTLEFVHTLHGCASLAVEARAKSEVLICCVLNVRQPRWQADTGLCCRDGGGV